MRGQVFMDLITCNGLTFECELGFHEFEKCLQQKITLDFEAGVTPISLEERDEVSAIRIDYYKANLLIRDYLKSRKFHLIETVADEVATLLLKQFNIISVKVTVTKFPLGMPNATSVSYTCFRQKK